MQCASTTNNLQPTLYDQPSTTHSNMLQRLVGCREGFPEVRQVLHQVVDHLKQTGPQTAVDVDALCSGAMWDAIGDKHL